MSQLEDIETRKFPTFTDYLEERGLTERVRIRAEKRAVARQISEQMTAQNLTKSEMAERMGTSRAQLDRVLNPSAQNVTIETLARAAEVLGRRFHMELI
jgi:antitoxin HicB